MGLATRRKTETYVDMKERGDAPSYRQISLATGLDVRHVSRIMRGQSTPSLDTFVRIAKALGCTLDYLWDLLKASRKGS